MKLLKVHNNTFKNIIQICLIFILYLPCYSQIRHGGKPLTYQDKIIIASGYNLPIINNEEEIIKEENIYDSLSYFNGYLYAKCINVDIDIKKLGTLKILQDSSKLWLFKVSSATTFGMQFYFDKFHLQDGAKLFFYNEAHSMILGSFTNANNHATNAFSTQPIQGNTIYIEYSEPKNCKNSGILHIPKSRKQVKKDP